MTARRTKTKTDLGVEREKSSMLRALERDFARRRSENSKYSLRAYARSLGVSPALLSLVFSKKAPVSSDLALRLRAFLGPRKKPTEEGGIPRTTSSEANHYLSPEFVPIDESTVEFKWLDLAIADLLTLDCARSDIGWVASALGVEPKPVADSFERLSALGIIRESSEKFLKTRKKIQISSSVSRSAIRDYHRTVLERTLSELERTDQEAFDHRHIAGMTIAVNPEHFAEAERRIEAFHQELADLLTRGKCTALYQLGTQLIPLYRTVSRRAGGKPVSRR